MLPAVIVHRNAYDKRVLHKRTQQLLVHPRVEEESMQPPPLPPPPPLTVDEREARLYRLLRTFLILCELFVCLPYGIHQFIPSQSRCTYLLKFLQLFWCILIYVSLIGAMYFEYMLSNINLPTVQKPLYFCEYLVYLIHTLYIIVSSFSSRHSIRRLFRTIAEFEHTLASFGSKSDDYRKLKRFIEMHMFLVLLYCIATFIVNYFDSKPVVLAAARRLNVYLPPNLVLCFSLIQYYIFLYIGNQCAVRLNKVLSVELSQRSPSSSPQIVCEKLQSVRLLYSALEVFTKDVNTIYGPLVVFVFIGSVSNFSVNLFLMYKFVDGSDALRLVWILYSTIWVCLHVSKMFLILYYNTGIEEQKSNTTLLMNEVRDQNFDAEETFTHFTLQLVINARTNVVCGVAVLNMSFVTSILVAVTTVFIFLLQYDITFEALTQTRNSAANIN